MVDVEKADELIEGEVRRQAAVLGLMCDPKLSAEIVEMMAGRLRGVTIASLAFAMGFVLSKEGNEDVEPMTRDLGVTITLDLIGMLARGEFDQLAAMRTH